MSPGNFALLLAILSFEVREPVAGTAVLYEYVRYVLVH